MPQVLTLLCKHAYKWNEIGIALGFSTPELRSIGSKLVLFPNAPTSFFEDLLNEWVHWPNEEHKVLPTVEALETALQSHLVGLGAVSETLRSQLLEQKASNHLLKQPGAIPPPECVKNYTEFLKSKYHNAVPIMPAGEWPPNRGRQYSDLTMVEKVRDTLPDQESVEERIKAMIKGQVRVSENERVIKSLDDVLAQDSNKHLKVLVEGIPGVGKSTLVRKSHKDWVDGKSLQQFHLVLLATLRERKIRLAKSVEDLLEADDPDLNREVARHLQKTSGEDVLFIFDGYDELNEEEQPFFQELIQGKLLHKCSIVLTSRSYAVEDLKYEEWIHRHVEILGFTDQQMEIYFLQNVTDRSVANALAKSLREETSLSSISNTPLNCSILLYIFQQGKFKLPNSLTELFSAFVISLLKRHAEKKNDKKLVKRLKNMPQPWLMNVPEPLKQQFSSLCMLAYDGLIKGKFIFSPKDITEVYQTTYEEDMEANLLSLMVSTTSFSSFGEETHYQFLHANVQEFLAANWITDQPEHQQKKFLSTRSVNSARMKSVLCFFAGIAGIKKKNEILKEFLTSATKVLCSYRSFAHHDPDSALTEPINQSTASVMQGGSSHSRKALTHDDKQQEKRMELHKTTRLLVLLDDVKESSQKETKHRNVSHTKVPVATRALVHIASMLNEANDKTLYGKSLYSFLKQNSLTIELGHFKLSTVDCVALAKFLSNCPYPLKSLRFNFCNLTQQSIKTFLTNSQVLGQLTQCREVQLNYCSPCFSSELSLLSQIPWFKHTKVLCLHGLKYPESGALRLHCLLGLNELTDLTITIEGIPKNYLSEYEKVSFLEFVEALKKHKTLQRLTYHQSPSAATCESFVQLMSALSHNTRVSLTLGHAKIITEKAVIIPKAVCFKLCCFGLASAMKLANARGIKSLQILNRSHNLLLPCHGCQITMGIKAPIIKPCVRYDNANQAVTSHRFDFSTYSDKYLKVFHDTSPGTAEQQCNEFCIEHGTPSLTSMLSLFPQISWFQHTKVLCLRGLQYPIGLNPEAFQLHSLLTLKTLTHLTVTIKEIPEYQLSDCEAVFVRFTEALQKNMTLQDLTYDQSPSAATCESFLQLMSALSHNTNVSLTFLIGDGEELLITTENSQCTVNIPKNTCFKVCYKGMTTALKLADARGIKNLKLDHMHVFSHCKTCNMPLESENSTTCHQLNKCDYLEGLRKSVSTGLAENKLLQSLDISECQVTDEVAQCIAAGLAGNRTLKELNMSFHYLTSEGVSHILKSLNQSKTLEKMKLSEVDLKFSYNPTHCLAISDKCTTSESITVKTILEALLTVGDVEELVMEHASLAQSNTVRFALEKLLNLNQTLKSFHLGHCGSNNAILAELEPRTNYKNVSMKMYLQKCKNDTYNYYYSAVDAMYIFQSLQSNTGLEELNLTLCGYNVEFHNTGRGSETLGSTVNSLLSRNQTLKTLRLRWCRLDDTIATYISSALAQNQSLKCLSLSSNDIRLAGAKDIFMSLVSNTTLEHLDLSQNGLRQQIFRIQSGVDMAVEQMLTFNSTLRCLDMSSCGLDLKTAIRIASGLSKNHSLEILILDGNRIDSKGAVRIFHALHHHSSFKELDLSNNQFEMSSSDEVQLGNALRILLISCQSLTKLGLKSCRLGNILANHLATGLANNHSLKILNLSDNNITGAGAVPIFKTLESNTSLEELDISRNNLLQQIQIAQTTLSGSFIETMLSINQSLRRLDLSDCKLDDVAAAFIATGLAKNHSLKTLELSWNNITTCRPSTSSGSEAVQILFAR